MDKLFNVFGIYFLFFLFFQNPIFANPTEVWSKKSAQVGELVEYKLIHDLSEEDIVIPAQGFVSKPNMDLPYAEIVHIENTKNKIIIHVKFLEVGDQVLPIQWKDASGEMKFSELPIQIQSSLAGQEVEVLDIVDPIEFSGPFVLRIIMILIGFALVLSILYYIFLRKKPTPEFVKDAGFEVLGSNPKVSVWLKLEALLEQEEFFHKDFVFLLSSSIKETLSDKYKYSVYHLTNKDLMVYIKEKNKMSDLDVLRWENYFNMLKYMPNGELIKREKAKEIVKYWKEVLRV